MCHPALANDNLSGVVLLWALARTLLRQELAYTYRIVWGPGRLDRSAGWPATAPRSSACDHGLAISCVGDPGPLRYKRSRRGDAEIDRAAAVLLRERPDSLVSDWSPLGGDERQYCSPGFDLPVGTFSRTPHGLFPEYHSSADDLDLVTAPSLGESFRAALEIIDAVETNGSYLNRSPYGEPRLGKRGLYQSVPDGTYPEAPLLWVLSLSDGAHDLIAIAERSGLPYRAIREAAATLERRGQNDQQRRQPRRRQVDQIVESCGGKPEVAVTRRAMADHAVGGVDRLVGRATGQAADRQPEHRRDDSVGEILREAFDRRPRDAGLVERVGIAPDDLRHRLAAAGGAFLFERRRDALDMVVEATLGNQRAGDEGNRH